MKLKYFILGAVIVFLDHSTQLRACTSFSFLSKDSTVIAAKNYDWFFLHVHGAIYVYPRNSLRIAFTPEGDSIFPWFKKSNPEKNEKPSSWRSKYGNITFTQFGKGLPIGGMNEAGLVVEMLQLNSTKYPHVGNGKFAVNESQWALYQLDKFASVQEVADHLTELTINKTFIGIHYFITDAFGASAVIEFLDGVPTIYHRENLPIPALTNHPYLELVAHRELQQEPSPIWFLRNSVNRFTTASQMLKPASSPESIDAFKNDPVEYAFRLLSTVCLNGTSYDAPCEPTQWSIVYDITKKEIHYKSRERPTLKILKMNELNFNSLNTVQVLDMNSDLTGNVTSYLENYSSDFNSKLVEQNCWLISRRLRNAALEHADQEGFRYDD